MKRVPFRQRSIDHNINGRVPDFTGKQSTKSQQLIASQVSAYSKSEKFDTDLDSITLKKNQDYIEKIDEELRNFGQNDQSSFCLDTNHDNADDSKEEYLPLSVREQGLLKT